MKKLSIAAMLFVSFIGLGSASATIYASLPPSPVYVGQPWYAAVAYLATLSDAEALCDFPDEPACYIEYAQIVYQGDFGQGLQCQSSCVAPCQSQTPLISGNSWWLLNGGLVYNTPGTRGITINVYSCIPGPGNGALLGSWTGSVSVLPQPVQPPAPTTPNPCTANQAVLFDPVASNLVASGAIVNDNSQLAAASTGVKGAAADGVTQLLLQIPATNPGDSLTIQVLNENNQTDTTANDGGLFAIGSSSANPASSLTVTAANTSQGPMAFAAYISPTNFYRGTQDASNIQRTITFQVSCSSNSQSTAPTTSFLVRPPVVLVHGLWGTAEAWIGFGPQISPQNTTLWGEMEPYPANAVDYSSPVSVSSTNPAYPYPISFTQVDGNALGFSYNAPYVLLQLQVAIHNYGTYWNAAAVQADVVAHSMGGDISRTMPSSTDSGFLCGDASCGQNNYNLGPVHKLITIGTPHLGTPVAVDLLPNNGGDANSCVRKGLAIKGLASFQTVTMGANTPPVNGAVGDLAAAPANLPPTEPFPMAYLAGATNQNNLNSVGQTAAGIVLGDCSVLSDPLALDLTPTLWINVFGGAANDGLVPLNSQLNGAASNTSPGGNTYVGVIHTSPLTILGFAVPSELDPASGIPDEVITLLNEATNGNDFVPSGGGGSGGGGGSTD